MVRKICQAKDAGRNDCFLWDLNLNDVVLAPFAMPLGERMRAECEG